MKNPFKANCVALSDIDTSDSYLEYSSFTLGTPYPYDIVTLGCVKEWYGELRQNREPYGVNSDDTVEYGVKGMSYTYG